MKTIRKQLSSVAIISGLVASLNFVHAQTATVGSFNGNIAPVQTAQADSIVQIAAESQGLQQVSPADLPMGNTYWWVMPGGAAAPVPFLPQDLSTPIYQIADGQFLVDDTGGQVTVNSLQSRTQAQTTSSAVASALAAQANAVINLITQVQTAAANQQAQAMAGNTMAMGVPMPGDGGDSGTNSYAPSGSSYAVPDYGTNLWIANFALSSGNAVGIVSNTMADISYEIQYKNDLVADTQWLLQLANQAIHVAQRRRNGALFG